MRIPRGLAVSAVALLLIVAGQAIRWQLSYKGAIGAVGALFDVAGVALLAMLIARFSSSARDPARGLARGCAIVGGVLFAFALVQLRPRDCTHGFTADCGLTTALLAPPAFVLGVLLLAVPLAVGAWVRARGSRAKGP